MKRIIPILFLIFFIPGMCLADDSVIERVGDIDAATMLDPGGYKGAKWGMSLEAVKQLFPDVKWGISEGWITNPNAYQDTIFEHKANCLFAFTNDNKLNRVKINIMPKPTKSYTDFLGVAHTQEQDDVDLFNSILKVLRDKYGNTISEFRKTSESSISECNWDFPTTQITLTTEKYGDWVICISINYFQRSIKEGNKTDKDKL